MSNSRESQKLAQRALLLDTQQRSAFVAAIEDPQLRQQVDGLLEAETNASGFGFSSSAGDRALENPHYPRLQPGDRVRRVLIGEIIGEGGMGTVYEGFDEKLQRSVAVKTIRAEYLLRASTKRRFLQEAQILSQINHPSICQLYDLIEFDGTDLLILERVEGSALGARQLTEPQKLSACIQIASALAAAHEKGIVHRDLKPDNVMISDAGDLKVLDFGIARSTSSSEALDPTRESAEKPQDADERLTDHGAVVGTLRYMSPEQAHGGDVSTASDIYSFGIMLQELFSAEPVYQFDDVSQLLEKVKVADRSHLQGVSNQIGQLIVQLTQLRPERRPTARSVLDRLQWIRDLPTLKKRRRRSLAAAAIILTLGALAIWQWRSFAKQSAALNAESRLQERISAISKRFAQIYLLPRHDISDDKARADVQVAELFAGIGSDPALSEVGRSRLQGQLLLATEDFESAATLLQPGSAPDADVANAYVNRYLTRWQDFVAKHGNGPSDQRDAFDRAYLDPALNYARKIPPAAAEYGLMNAFLLWRDGQHTAAIAVLDEQIANQSWNHALFRLKLRVQSDLGYLNTVQGDETAGVTTYTDMLQTYRDAIDRARSFPANYSDLCRTYAFLFRDGLQRTGNAPQSHADAAIEACGNSLEVLPGQAKVMARLADVFMLMAMKNRSSGEDFGANMELARQWIGKAISTNPDPEFYKYRGNIEATQAVNTYTGGGDPTELLERSLQSYQLALDPIQGEVPEQAAYILADMLYSYNVLAHFEMRSGIPLQATTDLARALFDQAVDKAGDNLDALKMATVNMSAVYQNSVFHAYAAGLDPREQAAALTRVVGTILEKKGDEPESLAMLAEADLIVADYLFSIGQDALPDLESARSNIQAALAIHSGNSRFLATQASIEALLAATTVDGDFSAAHRRFEECIEANPNSDGALEAWGRAYFWTARHHNTVRPDRVEAVRRGIEKVDHAIQLNPANANAYATKAELIELGLLHGALPASRRSELAELWGQVEILNPQYKKRYALTDTQ